jgi:uncharacterized protein (TIGR02145 family)
MEEIKIGNQTWMVKNLDVDTFRNGDPIPEARTEEEWESSGQNGEPAWCYYDNDPANGEKYGKLYNWHAVNDSRGLVPEGWKVPTDEDWKELLESFDWKSSPLKSNDIWENTEFDSNESGFSALPSGKRDIGGDFELLNEYGYFWSETEYTDDFSWCLYLGPDEDEAIFDYDSQGHGLAIRCIKEV